MKVLRQRLGGARAVRGRRRPRHGARGADLAVSDRGAVDHRPCRGRQAIAEDPAADPRDRGCRDARPRPTSSSSSTVPISPIAWPGACAPRDPAIPIVDYVSPSVWAWRPGRARAMLRYVDHVLALLPFEPEAYRRLRGPPCSYVGHPLIEQLATLRPNAEEQTRRDAAPPVLLVLPGSRRSEIRHHMAVFGADARPVAGRGRGVRTGAADHAASAGGGARRRRRAGRCSRGS